MSNTDHESLDRELFEVLWTSGNLDLVDRHYGPNFVCHNPPQSDIIGRAGIATKIRQTHEAYTNLQYTVEDHISENDRTLTRWTMRGALRKPLRGADAEGQDVTITGLTLARYVDGLIEEEWTYWDQLGLQKQLR